MKKLKCESENNFLQKYFKFEKYNGTYFVRKTNEYHENNKGKMIKKTFSQIIIGGETKRKRTQEEEVRRCWDEIYSTSHGKSILIGAAIE